jgi:hypothetical protein
MYISAFFSVSGVPAVGLTPTIIIYNLTDATTVVNGAIMASVGNGIYKYNFSGYSAFREYSFICDGGIALNAVERYVVGGTDEPNSAKIADGLLDFGIAGHTSGGTPGLAFNTVLTNLDAKISAIPAAPSAPVIADAVWDELEVGHTVPGTFGGSLSLIRQVQTGKWEIVGNTMTIYADNGTDVLLQFDITDRYNAAISLDPGAPATRTPV